MKNVVKLEHYYYPWELEQAISKWVEHYNHDRYHESLDNVTPADVYGGKRNERLDQCAALKSSPLTLHHRPLPPLGATIPSAVA